jgi:hypothetical protein
MGRMRLYASNADKQAAYRKRKLEEAAKLKRKRKNAPSLSK